MKFLVSRVLCLVVLLWVGNAQEPGPPTMVNGVQNGFTALDLTWTPPSEPNGLIIGHRVIFFEVGNAAFSNRFTMSGNNSYTLTGLDPDTTYNVSVVAINGAGSGQRSQSVQLSTAFGVFPPTMAVFSTSVMGRFTLVIGFNTIFGPIRYFQVVVTRSNTLDTRTINTLVPSSQYYVAFQADFSRTQFRYELGSGNSVAHNGILFNNSLLDGNTDYYVFIRAFSNRNLAVYNDSSFSGLISFTSTTSGQTPTPTITTSSQAPAVSEAQLFLITIIIAVSLQWNF